MSYVFVAVVVARLPSQQSHHMPLHIQDIASLFQSWWRVKVASVDMQSKVVTTSAASLQFWWPFLVWLTTMKEMISHDDQQYRQTYLRFLDHAHLHIMMQRGVNPETNFSLSPDTTTSATALIDCQDQTGLLPSQDQVRALQHRMLAEVRWKEIMLLSSQLVPELSMLKFVVADLNALAATCRFFSHRCRVIVASIQVLLQVERPWAFFVNSLPSIPKLNVQEIRRLWPDSCPDYHSYD